MSNGAAPSTSSPSPTGDAVDWNCEKGEGGKPRESCVKYFDALWFCYSPVYQMQQLYRYGEVDDCTGRWREFYDCLKKRTKFADQVKEDPNKGKPIWQIRTPQEASVFWQDQFGHLKMLEPQQAAATAEGGGKPAPRQEPGLIPKHSAG